MNPCRQCGWPFDVGADGLCKSCRELAQKPDGLSKKESILFGGKSIPFKDMKHVERL